MKRIYFAFLSLILVFILMFSLTACASTPTTFTNNLTETVTDTANFPYGGIIAVSLVVETAQDSKGDTYMELNKASYSIQKFYEPDLIDKIEFTYFDGYGEHTFNSDDLSGEYTVDVKKVPALNNNLHARAIVYMTNGETFEHDCSFFH